MKKSFGQHLLTDKNYLKKIVDAIDLKSDDIVLEIGAGSGLLTKLLARKVKKVYAVEIEREIIKQLKENIELERLTNVEILEINFLKIDLHKFSPFKIVGNIPYNITSQILLKLFGEIDKPASHLQVLKNVYLMLQLEVAQRVVAKPNTKAYSPLTLLIQYFTEPKILFKVPRNVFFPIPKVDSAFVVFHPKEKSEQVQNPAFLKNIIRVAFQQRRKKIINSLGKLIEDKKDIIEVLDKLHLDCSLRAENLSIDDYMAITNNIYAK